MAKMAWKKALIVYFLFLLYFATHTILCNLQKQKDMPPLISVRLTEQWPGGKIQVS